MDDLTLVTWRKSTRSQAATNCVEIADLDGGRAVRDSKDPTGLVLVFSATAWSVFTGAARSGEFD